MQKHKQKTNTEIILDKVFQRLQAIENCIFEIGDTQVQQRKIIQSLCDEVFCSFDMSESDEIGHEHTCMHPPKNLRN